MRPREVGSNRAPDESPAPAAAGGIPCSGLCSALVILTLAGCAAERATLHVGASADSVPGPGNIAVAERAGIRLEVRPGIEHPREWPDAVLPLFVIIENGSAYDLRVEPDVFHLVVPAGERHPAIPPRRLRLPEESSVSTEVVVAMRALPTDVLGAGGRTDGFLYCDRLETPGPLTVTFDMRAQDEALPLGFLAVPLVLR